MAETKVLVVEDDASIADIISLYLRREGIAVSHASDGLSGLNMAQEGRWDLIILDVMLPGQDGFEICRRLRFGGIDSPILFLTARTDDIDQVLGLGLGADDYITKPFSPAALAARVKANLRRYRELTNPQSALKVLNFGELSINTESCEVLCRGQLVTLTAKEYELLCFFTAHPGRVLTREQLFNQVWGQLSIGDDDTVTVHIRRLREKIEKSPSQPQYIVTVRGLGYKFIGANNHGG